ncbi:MAG: hypothetical protein M1812_006316 [Candelaria pacifica]|nr:MAG: hypothetical protein M1812_006316 [Candelaria pacifica]
MTDNHTPNAAAGLYSLPNELLMQILTPFPTRLLLSLTATSCRFHDIVLRLIHHRLLAAASLKEHKLILECFHPTCKAVEPIMYCDYLGTDGLSAEAEGEGGVYKDVERKGRLGQLGGLYSHFRPVRKDPETRVRRPHPAGDVPGHPNTSTSYPSDSSQNSPTEGEELVSQNVSLDAHELFSQLCTVTNIVKIGPHRGLFLSIVNVADGVVRIWREWLAERAASYTSDKEPSVEGKGGNIQASNLRMDSDIEKQTLWVDDRRNAGLVLRVKEKKWRRDNPILYRDEDVAVSYSIEYEKVLIRTIHLLLMLEQSLLEEANHSGKAIVIGSFT